MRKCHSGLIITATAKYISDLAAESFTSDTSSLILTPCVYCPCLLASISYNTTAASILSSFSFVSTPGVFRLLHLFSLGFSLFGLRAASISPEPRFCGTHYLHELSPSLGFDQFVFDFVSTSLSLAGNLGRLNWVRHSSCKSSATHSC